MKILVADDDPVNRRLASLLLERAGMEALILPDGLSALEAFREQAFDAVLLDMEMPVLDGPETARRMRAAEAEQGRPPVRILAVTGHTGAEEAARCREAGMDGVIVKPLGPAALARWLGKRPGAPEA
ncbi:CAI-1 autoinducer sensor kinase/phosphatase CqsS [Fundidesulfovibrio magnetotacticus]|uniref:CAI-1 autoinducer sensor kinase/phosphatase CqsS n=1 Tax=Fundidesulfovibrio magnetotacticus TaxID=2730080 RepID=A0A6V8LQ28_9BACT|nr:response regulator [Fundidesulfovibrio magnetotacticus]GFK94633.1 CAI-1 autoinducer sensor kinase/phosphatase CqsS [Fundidesulfovibrio magnetotacticus]